MSDTFRAIVFPEPNRAELREFPLPAPGPGEVRVRVTTSGISIGTEYLVLCGEFPSQQFPCLVGYQSVGIVESLGDGVTNLKPGDRVFAGAGHRPEGYHEGCGIAHVSHANIPALSTGGLVPRPIVIPSHVSDASASYGVLVAVALEGTGMADIKRNDTVAIVGLGVVGQLIAQVAKDRGANVFASDLDEKRVEIARKCGIDGAFTGSVEAFDREIRAHQEKGADIVFETSGNTKVLEQSLNLARNYGTFIVQGHYPGNLVFRFLHAHWRHLRMMFPCGGSNRRDAIDALDRGTCSADPLITHRVTPEDAPKLYGEIAKRSRDVLGAVIEWS